MNNLQWLQKWYLNQCDGDWEHDFGIHIDTLDNPGWRIKINIACTDLEYKFFKEIEMERSDNDWIHCSIKDLMFKGFCGPENLDELIKIFRDWVENNSNVRSKATT